jgi:ABC-type transport system involved in multi-copper enzyme maturation permease subunit
MTAEDGHPMSTTTDPTPPIPAGDPARLSAALAGRPAETAPSQMLVEGPSFARAVGMAGLFGLVLGSAIIISTKAVGPRWFPESWGFLFAALGIALMLYHAVRDEEQEVRRMYGALGALWLLLGVGAAVIPGPVFEAAASKQAGYNLLPWGVGWGLLGLLFLIPFTRHETDAFYRSLAVNAMLLIGGALALGSIGYGLFNPDWLAGRGVALALLGLGFLCAYLGQVETAEGIGYTVALGIGVLGAAVVVYAVARSAFPTMLYEGPNALRKPNGSIDAWKAAGRGLLAIVFLGLAGAGLNGRRLPVGVRAALGVLGLAGVGVLVLASVKANTLTTPPQPFLVPGGVILIGLGLLYLGVSLGVCSDNQFVTLTRRELAAYFLSPIGYLVLGGMALALWGAYYFFVNRISGSRAAIPEPIVRYFFIDFFPVFAIILQIPALTMRLLSEEKRSGSLEVLLTAPVNEAPVVLSKFLATWLFFLVSWLPAGLFLIAMRVETDVPFDYRPLLSFYTALAVQGAAFIAIGLFFSSLTRNQIVAAVLMFVVMLFFFGCFIIKDSATALGLPQFAQVAFSRLSFIDMWQESLAGQLPLRDVLLFLSIAVFFLFLSVKVLETRKWS